MFQKPCYISKKVSALYGEGEGCLYFRGFQRVPSDRGVFGCFRAGAWIHIAFVQGFVLTHLWRICITVFVRVRRFCYTERWCFVFKSFVCTSLPCIETGFSIQAFQVCVFVVFRIRFYCIVEFFPIPFPIPYPSPDTEPQATSTRNHNLWQHSTPDPATQSCAGYFCAHNTEHY